MSSEDDKEVRSLFRQQLVDMGFGEAEIDFEGFGDEIPSLDFLIDQILRKRESNSFGERQFLPQPSSYSVEVEKESSMKRKISHGKIDVLFDGMSDQTRGADTPMYYEADEEFGFEDESSDESSHSVEVDKSPPDVIFRSSPEGFIVLTEEQAEAMVDQDVSKVCTILEIASWTKVKTLLKANGWDQSRMLERIFQNRKQVLEEAGVEYSTLALKGFKFSKEEKTCVICCEDDKLISLACGHEMCKTCWGGHIATRIDENYDLVCFQPNCRELIDEELIQFLYKEKAIAEKSFQAFQKKRVMDIIIANPRLHNCQGRGCTRLIFTNSIRSSIVTCTCGAIFCTTHGCVSENHEPCDCDMVKAWNLKNQDDSETSHYISTKTKSCPKCKMNIEKDMGCNHMTCSMCRYEFCWICQGDWKAHNNNYNCNAYDESKEKELTVERAQLERYTHYWTRFLEHSNSEKLEGYQKLMNNRLLYLQRVIPDFESSRIEEFLNVLYACRKHLKWTYVYAYYLPKEELPLFELNQANLEREVERLAYLIESDEVVTKQKRAKGFITRMGHYADTLNEQLAHIKKWAAEQNQFKR